jgi:predicted TPR repeat methyltransferase
MSRMEVIEAAYAAFDAAQIAEAEVLCRRALREAPNAPDALYILGRVHSDLGDEFEAARLYEQALFFSPKYVRPYRFLARYFYATGQLEKSMQLLKAWMAVDPKDPEVQHLFAAVTSTEVPERCSESYIQTHFDKSYASSFDYKLVRELGYRGPIIIATAFKKYLQGVGTQIDVLDAGCGTGLCGPEIRQSCRTLVGVDLAEEMIRKASERGCYDELIVDEICSLMESRSKAFDAIISADVLIYFGALERVFRSVRHSLRPGGFLIVTTEALPVDAPEPYRLLPHGRYAHQKSYIADAVRNADLEVAEIEEDHIRWERGLKVMGYRVVARRSHADD